MPLVERTGSCVLIGDTVLSPELESRKTRVVRTRNVLLGDIVVNNTEGIQTGRTLVSVIRSEL